MSDADITALVAMLRHIQCDPASFDTYSMASAAERAADAIERLRSSGGARVEQDAARYQFLRSLHDPGPNDPRVHTLDQQHDPVQVRLCFGDDLDAVVDAAMRQP